MARFFPASDPAIERHFAMLDAGSAFKRGEEEMWGCERDKARSSHGGFFGERDNLHDGARSSGHLVDRASESARGGVRPRNGSARNRWPIGGNFAVSRSGATISGGANVGGAANSPGGASANTQNHTAFRSSSASKSPLQSYRPAAVSGSMAPVKSSNSGSGGGSSGSRQESPTSPLLLVAGRSRSVTSVTSSESSPRDDTSAGVTISPAAPAKEFQDSLKAANRGVKVVAGANPAAVELYFKRTAQQGGTRAPTPAARSSPAIAAVAGR
ncbi:hypothetical protein CLOM_g21624 [Closterium sp. NIES-68]|nr:hypothetical protein CLOM_g21624 [Closterium sp. NIES-68]GJP72930.1 hypothetical protein CLOP_g3698 [Closterium sp. NIES-67]